MNTPQLSRFFSIIPLLAFAALCAQADPVLLVQQGRAALVAKDIATANTRFQQALAEDPGNATANLFYAATRIVALSKQPAANTLMDRLGLGATGRDIYHWQSKFATNSAGDVIVPNISAAELFTFIHDQLIPQLIGAETNLANITSASFIISVTAAETSIDDATIDYGDIQVLRAILRAHQLYFYSISAWNMDVQLTALHQVFPEKIIDIETLLRNYPNLLAAGSDADLPKARAVFVAAIQTYFQGSTFIRARAAGVDRLFNLGATDLPNELKFRNNLEDLNASLTAPVRLRSNTNITVSAAKFFERVQAPRQFMPRFSGNRWVAGTLPDFTFGGVIQGLDQDGFESEISKKNQPASLFSRVTPSLPQSLIELTLNVAPDREMVIDVSSNLVDWTEYDTYFPNFDEPTNKIHFSTELQKNGPPRFFRASSDPLYLGAEVYDPQFQAVPNATITITDGHKTFALSGGPSAFSIGIRFLPPAETYTLSASAPGFGTQVFSISSDEIQSGHAFRQFQLFPQNSNRVAPTSLNGRKYTYSEPGDSGTLSFTATNYSVVNGGGANTGTYIGVLNFNTWSLSLDGENSLTFIFSTATSGSFVYTNSDNQSSIGTFVASP